MIWDADSFEFKAPAAVVYARKILIKPDASIPLPHPITTSRETLAQVIAGIRKVSDADIILLETSHGEHSVRDVCQALRYDFPRICLLDVRDCNLVEVENPLPKPFAMANFWVPNILLSCDYLITIAPFKIIGGGGCFTINNLLGLLPPAKYTGMSANIWELWHRLGIHAVIADLYFTLPFDLGIIDGRKKLIGATDSPYYQIESYGKIFVGPPFEVDREASQDAGLDMGYLRLIEKAKTEAKGLHGF